MIVLFIKSDLIKTQALGGYACPHCHQTTSLDMELRQRYAEFGTMSINPRGVFGVVHCLHCGHTIPASRWTDDMHRAFVRLKTGYKTPRKYWTGLVRIGYGVVAFFVLFSLVMIPLGWKQRTDNEATAKAWQTVLNQPKPGMTLAVGNGSDSSFEAWRVSRTGDGVVWLKKYTGSRTLTDFFHETGWKTMPDSEFTAEALDYSAIKFADKCLMRSEAVGNPTKHCEYVIFGLLDK